MSRKVGRICDKDPCPNLRKRGDIDWCELMDCECDLPLGLGCEEYELYLGVSRHMEQGEL